MGTSIDPGNDPDFIASSIASNLRYPPPGVIPYWGYLTAALKRPSDGYSVPQGEEGQLEPSNATEVYWRLYRSLELNEYIEFRDADVVFFQKLALSAGSAHLEGGVVWLKAGSRIEHVRVSTIEIQANFLQGPMLAGTPLAQSTTGYPQYPQANVSWSCGGHSFSCGGQSFSCGGQSFACGGQSFACGGQSFSCGGTTFVNC